VATTEKRGGAARLFGSHREKGLRQKKEKKEPRKKSFWVYIGEKHQRGGDVGIGLAKRNESFPFKGELDAQAKKKGSDFAGLARKGGRGNPASL